MNLEINNNATLNLRNKNMEILIRITTQFLRQIQPSRAPLKASVAKLNLL